MEDTVKVLILKGSGIGVYRINSAWQVIDIFPLYNFSEIFYIELTWIGQLEGFGCFSPRMNRLILNSISTFILTINFWGSIGNLASIVSIFKKQFPLGWDGTENTS